jgi:hypothetical protein
VRKPPQRGLQSGEVVTCEPCCIVPHQLPPMVSTVDKLVDPLGAIPGENPAPQCLRTTQPPSVCRFCSEELR